MALLVMALIHLVMLPGNAKSRKGGKVASYELGNSWRLEEKLGEGWVWGGEVFQQDIMP